MKRMRIYQPKGVTVLERRRPLRQFEPGRRFEIVVKSRGRTGAAARSLLMRLNLDQRDAVAAAWIARRPAEILA
jgi:hypothetical protein